MDKIEFNNIEKENIIKDIKSFFYDELDQDIGDLKAMFVLDFFIETIGLDIYNKGVEDSYNFIFNKLNDIGEIKLYKK